MFSFIKKSFQKIYQSFSKHLQTLFGLTELHEDDLDELERILLESDLGAIVSKRILQQLRQNLVAGRLQNGHDLRLALKELLGQELSLPQPKIEKVVLLVGVNGSGKTSLAAKLARYYQNKGEKILLVAADSFRAAATQQLQRWADALDVDLVSGVANQDPASIVYHACERFNLGGYDRMVIDSSGRLQTKKHLMDELGKVKRVILKKLDAPITTLLVLDAMLGQNSLTQAEEFHKLMLLDGIVLTKMDGTARGGIAVAVAQKLSLPVCFISHGEGVGDLETFNLEAYLDVLVS